MAYDQIPTIKIARPDTPEGYMIINAADYRADCPASMYAEGLAYDPAVYPPYVEQPLKTPGPEAPEAPEGARVVEGQGRSARGTFTSGSSPTTEEKK